MAVALRCFGWVFTYLAIDSHGVAYDLISASAGGWWLGFMVLVGVVALGVAALGSEGPTRVVLVVSMSFHLAVAVFVLLLVAWTPMVVSFAFAAVVDGSVAVIPFFAPTDSRHRDATQ